MIVPGYKIAGGEHTRCRRKERFLDRNTIEEIRNEIPAILERTYPMQVWTMEELGGYRNWVCQISCHDAPVVLRITPAARRSLQRVKAEIELVATLAERGVPVAPPAALPGVPVVKRVRIGGGAYYIVAFEKAAGLKWNEVRQGPVEYHQAGRVLAKIHHVTATLGRRLERPNWDENDYITNAKRVLPREKRWVLPLFRKLIEELCALPRDPKEFGLVHGDYNFANMLYGPRGLTVIDFDDSEYHWYAYDLAVYLFYYMLGKDPANMDLGAAREVWRCFLEGYRTERELPRRLLEYLPHLLRLREYMLYSSVYQSLSLRPWGAWQRSFVSEAEMRFRTGSPFVEVVDLGA